MQASLTSIRISVWSPIGVKTRVTGQCLGLNPDVRRYIEFGSVHHSHTVAISVMQSPHFSGTCPHQDHSERPFPSLRPPRELTSTPPIESKISPSSIAAQMPDAIGSASSPKESSGERVKGRQV